MLEVVLECTTYGGDPRTHPLPLSLSHPRTKWRHPMATPYGITFILYRTLGNWGGWVFGGGRNSAEAKRRVLVVSFTRSYKQDSGR